MTLNKNTYETRILIYSERILVVLKKSNTYTFVIVQNKKDTSFVLTTVSNS